MRFRLSRLAEADLADILAASDERWGAEGRRRYAAVLVAAMRRVAAEPEHPMSRDRIDLLRGVRSFHLRHLSAGDTEARVKRPVHVLYYRIAQQGSVEIMRVLHERMEPSHHVDERSL